MRTARDKAGYSHPLALHANSTTSDACSNSSEPCAAPIMSKCQWTTDRAILAPLIKLLKLTPVGGGLHRTFCQRVVLSGAMFLCHCQLGYRRAPSSDLYYLSFSCFPSNVQVMDNLLPWLRQVLCYQTSELR